jgi:hypothetical protein
MRETQSQVSGTELVSRIPQATFVSLISYLKSLGREDLQNPLVRPPKTDSRTWAQIRASLTALGMVQKDQGTLVLRRIVTGETSLLDVIESQVGSDVVAAIERGGSCAIGLLIDIRRQRSQSSIFRFESLVRMALEDQGRHPKRRHSEIESQANADIGKASSANDLELTLFELEGQHLVNALGDRLDKNDLNSAREIREMLRDLHDQLKRPS